MHVIERQHVQETVRGGKSPGCNQCFCILAEIIMAQHDAFRLPCGTRRIEQSRHVHSLTLDHVSFSTRVCSVLHQGTGTIGIECRQCFLHHLPELKI